MKSSHLKRTVGLLTAALLLALTLVPAFAADGKEKANPVLIITGFGTYPFADAEGKKVFPPSQDEIKSAVTGVLPDLMRLMASPQKQRDYDAFYEKAIPVLCAIFEPAFCRPDGTPAHPEVRLAYQYEEPESAYTRDMPGGELLDNPINAELLKKVSPDRVFVFGLDWRLPPFEIADELHKQIVNIQNRTGSKKVSVAGISMGGLVLNAYVAKYGAKDLSNITMISSAFTGVGYVGELFKGKIKIDEYGLYEMITEMVGTDVIVNLLGSVGVLKQALALADTFIYYEKDRMYRDFVLPGFAYNPTLWSFVPPEDFAEAKKYIFSISEASDADKLELEGRITPYYRAQLKTKNTLEKAMRDGASLAVTSNYNLQMPPVSPDSANNGDQIIETMYTSGGATCAPLGGLLPNSIKNGKHVSCDRVIDASTCMFPEQTWFIKNMSHADFNNVQNQCKFFVDLITAKKQVSVRGEPGYPQFLHYDKETKLLSTLADSPAIKPPPDGKLTAPDLSSVIDPSALSGLTSMLDPSALTGMLGPLGNLFGGAEGDGPATVSSAPDTPALSVAPDVSAAAPTVSAPTVPAPIVAPAAPAVPANAVPAVSVKTDASSPASLIGIGAAVLAVAIILSAAGAGAGAASRKRQ